MIPDRFIFTGDESKGRELIHAGKRLLSKFKDDLRLGGHKSGKSRKINVLGGTVHCEAIYGCHEVHIHIPKREIAEEPAKPVEQIAPEIINIETEVDNRFFVRVGNPATDITIDEFGHVTSDDTRYYWIDFNAFPLAAGSDKIGFYTPGEELESEYGNILEKTIARDVTDSTFFECVNLPDYMFHSYVRSFDMSQTVEGVLKTDRFVAGYNYLTTGDNIIYLPEILPPTGGEIDGYDISKCPQNRFFVDIESRTMAWYHVLQEWWAPPPLTPPHTLATGSMSGVIVGIDSQDGRWEKTFDTSFSLTGDSSSWYSVTTTGSDTIKEPIGILSDITALSRTAVKMNIPLYSTPIEFTAILDPSFLLTNCESIEIMETNACIATGYDIYPSASVTYSSGGGDEDIPLTEGFNYYTTTSCPGRDPCELSVYEILEDYWSYYETYGAWSENIIEMSIDGMEVVGWAVVVQGEENGQVVEGIWGAVHGCKEQFGGCNNQTYEAGASRSMQGYVSGTFGSKYTVTMPLQNTTLLESTTKIVDEGIQVYRRVEGPESGLDVTSLSTTLSNWNDDAPLDYNDTFTALSGVEYPRDYFIEDPANWFSCLNYYPFSLPELTLPAVPTNYWYGPTVTPETEVETNDICKIKDCAATFIASDIFSIVILDDRWSTGSQGLVVAVKSNNPNESAIYHGLTEANEDKTDYIITALIRDGILIEDNGDQLLDIGLV